MQADTFIAHTFEIAIIAIDHLLLPEVWDRQQFTVEFHYMWSLQKVRSLPIAYFENQDNYQLISSSSYMYLQRIGAQSSPEEVVENPEGGIRFNLLSQNQVVGFGMLSSNELGQWLNSSGIYGDQEKVQLEKKKAIVMNIMSSHNTVNVTPCKLQLNIRYSGLAFDQQFLQSNQHLLDKHNRVHIDISLPHEECQLQGNQRNPRDYQKKHLVSVSWADQDFLHKHSIDSFTREIKADMSETVSTEYKIEVSEDFKNCLEQNSFVVQLLQQESDQHNAVIVGHAEVPMLPLATQELISHRLTIVDRRGLYMGLVEFKAQLNKYSTVKQPPPQSAQKASRFETTDFDFTKSQEKYFQPVENKKADYKQLLLDPRQMMNVLKVLGKH